MSLKELKFLPKVYVGMVQLDENINHLFRYYSHEPGETLILDESIDMMIMNKQITRWTFTVDEQLNKLNLGTIGKPYIMLVNTTLPKQFQL